MRKKIIIGLAVLITIILLIIIFTRKGEQQVIQTTDTAGEAMISLVLRQTGIIKPQVGAMISIGARATGLLEKVNVQVGDRVTEGQLVAQIDSRAIRQNINQARDLLEKARIDLEKAVKLFPVQKAMQENTVISAKSNYEYLKGVYDREKTLYENGYSRKETLDKTLHDMTTAQTDYEKQQLQLQYMQTEHESNLVSLRAEIRRLEASLEEQEIQLTYTEIYSPINGVVSEVKSVEGETIVAGLEVASLITVFRPELLEMYVYVDESDIGKVTEGMLVKYTVDTYPDREFSGTISRINLQSETKDGVIYYIAIVGITEEDAMFLRPEMTTSARIISGEKSAAVSVAAAAVKWEDGTQVIYKVKDLNKNLTEKIPVKIGMRGEDRVEVLEGINAGDEVVVRFSARQGGR